MDSVEFLRGLQSQNSANHSRQHQMNRRLILLAFYGEVRRVLSSILLLQLQHSCEAVVAWTETFWERVQPLVQFLTTSPHLSGLISNSRNQSHWSQAKYTRCDSMYFLKVRWLVRSVCHFLIRTQEDNTLDLGSPVFRQA